MNDFQRQAINYEIERRENEWAISKIRGEFSKAISDRLIYADDAQLFLILSEPDLVIDEETNQTLLIVGFESDRETPILETIESRISKLEKNYPEKFKSSRMRNHKPPKFFKWVIKSTSGFWIFKKTVAITGFYSEEEAQAKAIALKLKNFTIEKV
jgi:hypothetical protein